MGYLYLSLGPLGAGGPGADAGRVGNKHNQLEVAS